MSDLISESTAGSVRFIGGVEPPITNGVPYAEVAIGGFGPGARIPRAELDRMCREWLAYTTPAAAAADPADPDRLREFIAWASEMAVADRTEVLALDEDQARNLLVAAGWLAGAAAGQLGLVLDDAGEEPLC